MSEQSNVQLVGAVRIVWNKAETELVRIKMAFFLEDVAGLEEVVESDLPGEDTQRYCAMKFYNGTTYYVAGSYSHWYKRLYTHTLGINFNLTTNNN